ncbi:MAG: endonuclease III domain-containing protein [Planctomycetota bacterium]|jgi:endonuclease-3
MKAGKGKPKSPAAGASTGARLRRRVARIARKLGAVYGKPKYNGGGPILDSLIGCILSQNTNDRNSGAAWRSLRERFPTWASAAAAPRRKIEESIRVGGLAPSKSARIKAILSDIKATRGEYKLEFLHRLPDEEAFEYLTAMNGVGVKTAAVVLLFAMGRDVFPVDTHIHRIAQRLGFVAEGASRDNVFEAMRGRVPKGAAYSLHVNLIRFGRDRCRKRKPLCKGCPLRADCRYVKGLVSF